MRPIVGILLLFGLSLSAGGDLRAAPPQARCPTMDPRCKEVELVAPGEPRKVVKVVGPVRFSFGRGAFLEAARARRRAKLVTWLEAHGEEMVRLDGTGGPGPELANAITFVTAELLEAGQAQAIISKTGKPVERIVVQRWDWVGCSGGCRQAGREFRLTVPGKPFLRTTDTYGDGLPGTFTPPPAVGD